MTERLQITIEEVSTDEGSSIDEDFTLWEQEIEPQASETETLEQEVLENPEEPQMNWVESNPDGTVSEEQYQQQSYWVIGQFGHALDVIKDSITTDEQAEEWFDMKMSIAAAKSISDAYELARIRSEMIPIWTAYVEHMNVDWESFEKVSNK